VLFPGEQNSREGTLNFLNVRSCSILVASKEVTNVVDSLRPDIDAFKFHAFPDLGYFTSDEPVKMYPFTSTSEEIKNNVVVVLHTSGSTGRYFFPKLNPTLTFIPRITETNSPNPSHVGHSHERGHG
jgi:hypothetical protein